MSTKLTGKESIPSILKEMTVEEKALLITGRSSFMTRGFEKYGIPSCRVLDGGTGVNLFQYYGDVLSRALQEEPGRAKTSLSGVSNSVMIMHLFEKEEKGIPLTDEEQEARRIINEEMEKLVPSGQLPGCFPPGMMLGATWDPETVYLCGNAVAKEMDVYKVDMVLGSPNVNIHRDPLNGRVFEGYSEDPCLTAELAPEFVKGVQDEGLVADVKHFAANNQETHRQNIDEIIPLRALYEIYFPGFKACVQEGKVKSVMDAYNKINGKACAMNSWLLTDVLREEWGYQGLVVSDWGAVYNQAEAIMAGNDLDMPGPRDIQPILDAVQDGSLSEEALDLAATHVLEMLLDMPVMKGRKTEVIDREYSRRAAYQGASEGCVLLKNKDGLLPLSDKTNISFMGERSRKFLESGGGSAMVHTDQSTSMVEVMKEKIGKEHVRFGTIEEEDDVVVITVSAWGQEGNDRVAMDVDTEDKKMLLDAVQKAKRMQKRIVVILNIAGPVDMSEYVEDVDAILCVFLPGQEGGRVAAEILLGEINPSGKLPLTFPKKYRDCPTYGNFPGCAAEVCYGEGIFVGYRYYEYKGVEPLYPFGFGLSYSNFRIHDLKLSSDSMNMEQDEKITVSVKVKNISQRAGKEVVQLYIRDIKSTLVKPVKELKAFKKIFLEAGEEKEVCFTLSQKQLESYDPELKQWVAEAGTYEILVGNSSAHITASACLTAKGKTAYNYNSETMLAVLYEDDRAKKIMERKLKESGVNPMDLQDCLYYFPHRAVGVVLKQLFGNVPNKTKEEQNKCCEEILAELNKLDLSVL